MPHALPSPGLQALILCGPGFNLNTFTANPKNFPKALVPIANRPMVWYPLDWCYRMGVTNLTLVTPSTSEEALNVALSQNPHLTSLPLPKADVLVPKGVDQNTPTAEVLRSPEVQAAITGDFLVLPCDLVCELPGESLLGAWMALQGSFGGEYINPSHHPISAKALRRGSTGSRGGMGVYFETDGEDSTKGTETDFVITASLSRPSVPPPEGSLRPHISKLLYATTTDTLRDITHETTGEKKAFLIRDGLIRRHGKIRMLTRHRDAHIYVFPYWVSDMIKRNETFDSVSEDVIGWWAKASWQDGLPEKLHLHQVFNSPSPNDIRDSGNGNYSSGSIEDEIDLASMCSTYTSSLRPGNTKIYSQGPKDSNPSVPPIYSYIHPSNPKAPLIRRVDNPHILLRTSLYLATLPPSINPPSGTTPTSYSHTNKISTAPTSIGPQTKINVLTTLIAPNTTIGARTDIKSSVIGDSCVIGESVKLTGCLLMDAVVLGDRVVLQGCILGRRCIVGKGAVLKDCEVEEGYQVADGIRGTGKRLSVVEGLDETMVTGRDEEEINADGQE